MDLLLALAYYLSGPVALLKQDSLLFLEIFHHIFWGQSPEKIARVNDSNPRVSYSFVKFDSIDSSYFFRSYYSFKCHGRIKDLKKLVVY